MFPDSLLSLKVTLSSTRPLSPTMQLLSPPAPVNPLSDRPIWSGVKPQAPLTLRPLRSDTVFDALCDADSGDKSTYGLLALNSLGGIFVSALSSVQYSAIDLVWLFGLCVFNWYQGRGLFSVLHQPQQDHEILLMLPGFPITKLDVVQDL